MSHEQPSAPRLSRRRFNARKNKARSSRRIRILLGVGAFLFIIVLAGAFVVVHLNGNLRTQKLTAGGGGDPALNTATALNVLIIGSDTRASAADCKIGGDCSAQASTSQTATSAAANADVEMLVHLSADRTNATVMSIPRDTIVDIPQCTDADGKTVAARRDRINSALQAGINCQAATVNKLTGVSVNHFMVIDFSGVITMSDAVGGVDVCVDNDVYDTFSHLKLSKGKHTLQGEAALQFLRTRHGFGNGGDVGRTVAQHLFLSSMLRQMESASTLANPVKLYGLADAATKAVTVDNGLGSIVKLTSLGLQLNKVPSKAITFVTMPTVEDPRNLNVVLPAPNAQTVFTKIRNDTVYGPTKATATASASPSSRTPRASGASPSEAPDYATNVTDATGCANVSTTKTVEIKGVAMTPTQAYAASPTVADSAR